VQLSAQRLRRRFASQIKEGREVFDECTQTIESQVGELKKLVNEFSEFARMPESRPAPADLNALVAEAVALYRNALGGARGITVAFTPDPALPILDVDREQMKRAVINLLDNACAAASEGGGTRVTVATVFERALGIVRLTIADDGPGMAEEVKARLFEPYFSTKKGGTGLGLTIVHRIVADHEGFIRVQDDKPRGTRFVTELPVKDSASRRAKETTA
jgi:two-component system, NtrC family, nitrogen regulation sensor histidine kinase NtrY